MLDNDSKRLPIAFTKFSKLREAGKLYVDKTDMVAQIASGDGKYAFFRPRRFGKSLLVRTFESLFRDGLKDFQGLKIEKLWKDKTYDVVRLDFSKVRRFVSAEDYQERFDRFLFKAFRRAGFVYDPTDVLTVSEQIDDWLENRPDSSLVVLVDEYDAPLTDALNTPETFDYIRGLLADFYAILKSNEGCLRFFFLTGISKFQNANIFSELNDVTDLSMWPEYGTLLGFTREEIEKVFSSYLQDAAAALHCTTAEVLEQLTANYDGYCFERTATKHVYSTWSVLKFFEHPEAGFFNYWYSSAGELTVVRRYLESHQLASPEHYDEPLAVSYTTLDEPKSLATMSAPVLLTQTGYLTIRSVTSNDIFFVGYPNEEVTQSMAGLYASMCLKNPDDSKAKMAGLPEVMAQGSVEKVVSLFNTMFSCIDYLKSPVESEASCRSHLQVLLIGACLLPSVEVHGAHGRSDLEVTVGGCHWVFEFKFLKKESVDPATEEAALLEAAANQMKEKGYLNKALEKGHAVGVALVFSEAERQLTAWQAL